ncbi:CbtA family protein [Micromonospora sp. BRA006-A]|nr:CbtA family protein [Micromonospora sp. BRA006-A]
MGIVLGGATALAAAFAAGRLGSLSARASTAVVAAVGFVATALVPFLKYPPHHRRSAPVPRSTSGPRCTSGSGH